MKFLVDETSTPVGIRYPTEPNLLNEAREKIKEIIDVLHQPHVRPIVREKANADVEFDAKISVAMVDEYAFLEKHSWAAYNEAGDLKNHIENYKRRFGYYLQLVYVDAIYSNRENRRFGNGKRRYWWARITTKVKNTSETSIAMTVLVMNLEKITSDLLLFLFMFVQNTGFFLPTVGNIA